MFIQPNASSKGCINQNNEISSRSLYGTNYKSINSVFQGCFEVFIGQAITALIGNAFEITQIA